MTLNEFIESGDPMDIVSAIGIKYQQMHNKVSILCPSHDDSHFGSCYITPKGYYCFACGAKGNWLKMAADFWKMPFETHQDKLKVAEMIKQKVYPEKELSAQEGKDFVQHILSREELNFIGLEPYATAKKIEYNEYDHEKWVYDSSYSIWQLQRDDPKAFFLLLAEKTTQKKKELYEDYDYFEAMDLESESGRWYFDNASQKNEKMWKIYEEIQKILEIQDKIESAYEKSGIKVA